MIKPNVIPSHGTNSRNFAVLVAALAGMATAPKTLDLKDPKVAKAYAKLAAIEPITAYIAKKRGQRIESTQQVNELLADIRDNRITAAERVGIAKIFNAHVRIGNLFKKGVEGITGDNYGASIAFMEVIGDPMTPKAFAETAPVKKAFASLQRVARTYLEAQPKFEA